MKVLKKIGITILCLLLICGIGIVCLFHNEYSSLKSLKKIDAYPMYTMDYSADYGLDEFLEKGASNDKELIRCDLGEDFSVETAVVVAELYRHGGEWKFNAIGAGFQGGLQALCKNFGVNA